LGTEAEALRVQSALAIAESEAVLRNDGVASIPKLTGMIYALIAFPILLYLLYSNNYTKKSAICS